MVNLLVLLVFLWHSKCNWWKLFMCVVPICLFWTVDMYHYMRGFRIPCVCRRCNYHYYNATETGYTVCSHNHVGEDRWVVCATGTLHLDLDINCCIEDKAVCMINWVLQLCFCTVSFMLQSKSGVQLGLGFLSVIPWPLQVWSGVVCLTLAAMGVAAEWQMWCEYNGRT